MLSSVKSIIKKSFEDYLKELDQIKLEIVRARFREGKNLIKKDYEQSRKPKSK